jgi:trans-aconitate 2-methyltransferase
MSEEENPSSTRHSPLSTHMWDADQYTKFSRERSRPFDDLMAQVTAERPEFIVDLGCGTGSLTRTLAERWPAARVLGIDSSAEMLEKARPQAISGRLEFTQAGIGQWKPDRPVDLIVSNAALHWIPDHAALLRRLAGMLSPQGTLAAQMPDRFRTPSQEAIEAASADPRWSSRLAGIGLHRDSARPLVWYVALLRELGFQVNAWQTTYVHILSGENPVLDWLKGTALRPLLERLDANQEAEFLAEVGTRLKATFPPTGDVTFFPMPRLFFVASRG